MTTPTSAGALFMVLLFSAGLLYSLPLLSRKPTKGYLGAAIVVGATNYIIVQHFLHAWGPWGVHLCNLACAAGLGLGWAMWSRRNKGQFLGDSAPMAAEWGVLLGILAVFALMLWRMTGYDEIYHYNFASQIIRGKYPPSWYGFPEQPAAYHYGWGALLGGLSGASGLPLDRASSLLTLYLLGGCILMSLGLLETLGLERRLRLMACVLFFLGGGIFILPAQILFHEVQNGLATASMFHSHPWTLGYGVFLLVLYGLSISWAAGDGGRRVGLVCALPVLAIALVCGSLAPATLAMVPLFGFMSCGFFLRSKAILQGVGMTALCLVGLVFGWLQLGGVFARTPGQLALKVNWAIISLGGTDYIKYSLAYLLMAPVGLLGFLTAGYLIWKKRTALLHENPVLLAAILCSLCLFPLPLVFWFENISRWDNYCKFNFPGVLSAWLLLAVLCSRHLRAWPTSLARRGILALTLLVACHESVLLVTRSWSQDARGARERALEANSQLVRTLKEQTPVNSRILLVNRNLGEYYKVSAQGRMLVNLYQFLGTYYEDFIVVGEETGAAMVNFELMNGANVPGPKQTLLQLLERAHQGTLKPEDLQQGQIAYVLCRLDRTPAWISEWQDLGALQLVASNAQENWSLWRWSHIEVSFRR